MPITPAENENLNRLLHSGDTGSILVGLEIAHTLGVDVQALTDDIEMVYQWLNAGKNVLSIDLATKVEAIFDIQVFDFSPRNYSNFQLRHVRQLLGYMTQLIHLDVNSNSLNALPLEISNLTRLKYLSIHSNPLGQLPEWIGNITKLEVLYAWNTELKVLPVQLTTLTNLVALELSGNQITSYVNIGQLAQLKYLDISNNHLPSFPTELLQLSNLQILTLNNNQIQHIPADIQKLILLNQLGLTGNQLAILPKEIGNLIQLEELHLAENQLTDLPAEISNLHNLNYLDLRGNPMDSHMLSELQALLPNCWIDF